MENENKLYGNLFNTIDLLNEDHLEAILETMDKSHAMVYLIESVKAAHERNAFSIGETEVISKAIRILSRKEFGNLE
jgi:predicted transcriptional regulator